MKPVKIVVEKHKDGYVSYPLDLKIIVVAQGYTYEEVMADIKSASQFHMVNYGSKVLDKDIPILEASIAETGISIK